MMLYAISWPVVLIFCGICFCYDEYLNDFRQLCPILVFPALQNRTNPENFKAMWDRYLNIAGRKIFQNLDKNEALKAADDRCDTLAIDKDIICTFKDYATIGELVERDIRSLNERLDPMLESAWNYYLNYITAWFQHPRFVSLHCDATLERSWKFIAKLSHLESYKALLDMKSVYDNINSKGLRQEINRFCIVKPTDKLCLIKIWTNTADKVDKLLTYIGREQWDNISSEIYKSAIRLHFYGVKSTFQKMNPSSSAQGFLSTEDSEVEMWITTITFHIFDSIQNNQIESLVRILQLLPKHFDLPCDFSTDYPSFKRTICIFNNMLFTLHSYVKDVKGNIKHINVNIDYEKFLREKRLEQILNIGETTSHTLAQVTKHLKLESKKSFGEVKTYFQTLANFDFRKTQADISYIENTLNHYKNTSSVASKELDGHVGYILEAAMLATLGDAAEALLKLSFRIAQACNPLKALIVGGSAVQILDASQQLSRSLVGVTKAILLFESFDKLVSKSKEFVLMLSANENYLTTVVSLVNSLKILTSQWSPSSSSSEFATKMHQFLEDYKNYKPVVSKDLLREMTASWENFVTVACGVVESTKGNIASVARLTLFKLGSCGKAKSQARNLVVAYEEIYNFQFTLKDSLAEAMRAWTSFNAASMINSDFNAAKLKSADDPEIFEKLELLSAFSVICYRISVRTATDAYCDILEYLEGHRPLDCVEEGTLITSLLSRTPLKCHISENFYVVPTKPSNQEDKAYISLEDLYAGNPVVFKIPDSQWLIDHGWISSKQKHDTIFVQRFEIFLPVVSKNKKRVEVHAQATVGNQLTAPDGTEYMINPPPTLRYTYKEGRKGRECAITQYSNPYNDRCRGMPKICPITKASPNCASRGNICPSIYAQWNIIVYGYEKANLMVPSTDIPLLARLQFCSHPVSRAVSRQQKDFNYDSSSLHSLVEPRQKRENSDLEQHNKCCESNKYYNESENTCTACPSGTISKYEGLFCGKIIRFVPARFNETTFSFDDAQKACKTIASNTDIEKAVEVGDESCACGWLSDRTMAAPNPNSSCEEYNRESTITCHSNNTWGVYCLNKY
ncbi:hypothetical protein CHS0354_024604 [Potamilus streckersoni]|uniref:Link domain-containing protein n=1 Tax=Potamilus streckersoni TaxID=2493646 RepID=A0AAE0W114_9BIVA|nr:hypothetical protein CHS0354_024604 [Potamilus streckersoni]